MSAIEIALYREWILTAEALIDFSRCIIQAIDFRCSSLLQIPHFTQDIIKQISRGKKSIRTLGDFVSLQDENWIQGLGLDEDKVKDIQSFMKIIHPIVISDIIVEVIDEELIVLGDIVTISLTLNRPSIGLFDQLEYIHAPYLPILKTEVIWVIVKDRDTQNLVTWTKLELNDKSMNTKLKFQANKLGKQCLVIMTKSDSYAGIDTQEYVNFQSKSN